MSFIKFFKLCCCSLRNVFCWLMFKVKFSLLNIRNMINSNNKQLSDSDSDDDCEYDSTWEDELRETVKKKKSKPNNRWGRRNLYAARDMQEFRHSCRNLGDDTSSTFYTRSTLLDHPEGQDYMHNPQKRRFANLEFYRGQRCSEPDGIYIQDFHKKWWGRYRELERVHSYIQWLFPIQEKGMNWQSHVLTKEEIKHFRKDELVRQNLLISYKLMLDFYGILLVNYETGDVTLAPNWSERFDNLNRNTHNNLRITRILKCLGTLGFQHFQKKLVMFFLRQTLVENRLPNVKESVLNYFIFAVLDKSDRKELIRFAFQHYKPQKDFVWGPKKILGGFETGHCLGYEYTGLGKEVEKGRTPSTSSKKEVDTRKDDKKQVNEACHSAQTVHKDKEKCQMQGKEMHESSDQATPSESEKNKENSESEKNKENKDEGRPSVQHKQSSHEKEKKNVREDRNVC